MIRKYGILVFVFSCFALVSLNLAQMSSAQTPGQTRVLIGGYGAQQYVQTALDGLTDYLSSRGVSTKQTDGATRAALLDKVTAAKADSLLYVNVDIAAGQTHDKLVVQCFDATGKLLWQEEAGGGMAFSGAGAVKNMLNSIKKKLEPHIGQPGLPKA